jgi:tetratricopeptide (TPR) repeat protein
MLFLAALAAAAAGQSPYTPELEALMRHRDERRAAEARTRIAEQQQGSSLASVIPPAIAERLSACLASADLKPETGLADAAKWTGEGGGAYAAHCKGYALGKAGRFAEAAGAFESGATLIGTDAGTQARLWSQAGNAALAGGDAPRALIDLDHALEKPQPASLSTGEIHLDRARARVATGDLKGARADMDQALVMAPQDPLGWLLSATLARRMDDLPLARAHIEKAASLARNDADIALEQGVIYALSGDRDAAAKAAFQRAQEVSPKGGAIAAKATAYLAQLADAPPAPPAAPPVKQ